jgi:uncharacterized protein YyaL (SSP411 family)
MARISPNRLGSEPSLYLRQHARNPVDWYPWGDEALERAHRERRPILLSIGYSSCHWCHVMEHECFENAAIAELMNRLFVCIKVDREERPDLDGIYMKAVQAMIGRGGWPMTLFLTPERLPFYAGTYFPPVARGGLPVFPRVRWRVALVLRYQPDRLPETRDRVAEFLRQSSFSSARRIGVDELFVAGDRLLAHCDSEHGGFGNAPKFPSPSALTFLMGLERARPVAARRHALKLVLDRMAAGGIYDQLGGGFHRYSVDREWRVPHFEKMLYDQALLVDLYREGWLLFHDAAYRDVAVETLEYVAREMTSESGGFYATQDADSEGEEGKFFVWTTGEIRTALGERDAEVICAYFDVTESGNFDGANVLRRNAGANEIARSLGRDPDEVLATVERGRRKLFELRSKRVAPVTDRKVLTDWNGLVIAAMAAAGRLFGRPDLVDTARRAADFIRTTMWPGDVLFHFSAEGQVRVPAFLGDYAFFGRACLELYAATARLEYLGVAERCANVLLTSFEDRESGGFFFAARGDDPEMWRDKDLSDGAVPSGNAVATELLARLYALTGNPTHARAAAASLAAWGGTAMDNSYAGAHLLSVTHRDSLGYGAVVVASVGRDSALLEAALRLHAPEITILSVPPGSTGVIDGILRGKAPVGNRDTAYLCRGSTCGEPIQDEDVLATALDGMVNA